MKIAVITASIGIELHDPFIVFENIDYFAFVEYINEDLKCWNQIKYIKFTDDTFYENRRNAKIYKILPHLFLPNYDYYIWIDSTHEIMENPIELIDKYMKESDIGVFLHSERDCIYDEAKEVIKYNFDIPNLVINQIKFYKSNNYPIKNNLYELGAFIRKNTYATKQLNLMWWEQICKFSSRDQISFPYVLNKLKIIPSILPGKVHDSNAYSTGKPITNDFFKQVRVSKHKRIFKIK